jgi:hypothetical protein
MTDHRMTPELARRLTVDAEPWLSCDDCFALLDEYVERLLADPGYDAPAMRAHLRGCGACAEEAVSLLELAAADADLDAAPARARLQG